MIVKNFYGGFMVFVIFIDFCFCKILFCLFVYLFMFCFYLGMCKILIYLANDQRQCLSINAND